MADLSAPPAQRIAQQARKAINQWLDGADDRQSRAAFVLGCQRSGTTMLCRVLHKSPDLWVHPEKSALAYEDFRLRSPTAVDAVLWITPADTVVFKPLCDAQLGDQLLDLHEGSRAIWLWRPWIDVAASAVRKWGPHQRDVVVDLARGRLDDVGWRGERLPVALQQQLAEVVTDDLSPEAGAALFWYVRNSLLFSQGLDRDDRCLVVSYAALVADPGRAFPPVFAHLGGAFDARWVQDVQPQAAAPIDLDAIPREVQALCDALTGKLLSVTP